MRQAILASLIVLCIAGPVMAADQPGLKEDKTPPPMSELGEGYRGMDDAQVKGVEQAKTLHDGGSVTLQGFLIKKVGGDVYRFRDKTGEIDAVIPLAMFDGKQLSPDDLVRFSGTLDKKHQRVRVTHFQPQ